MTEYQIILLPRQHYWEWVRAARLYAMAYHAYLTQDPETAVRNISPSQVVTVVVPPEGYPAQGNIVNWIQQRLPGIKVDTVAVDSPAVLQACLNQRVIDNNRFGTEQTPLKLHWPTDYPVVTQPFGANPAIYRPMGMPGHEGIDIRALMNTNIYACADGEVYFVNNNPQAHNYGIHIRIKHGGGYRTIYGHLARVLVSVGDVVKTGQLIGKADSTGNSSGSHLHLSLKKDGATDNKLTTYPKDIIDPTPFLVWPVKKDEQGKILATEIKQRCLVGLDGSQFDGSDQDLHDLISQSCFEAIKISSHVPEESIQQLKWKFPGIFIAANLSLPNSPVTREIYADQIKPILNRLSRQDVNTLEVFSQPNLSFNGWGKLWRDGKDFSGFFTSLVEWIKADFPGMRLGFPGLSTGNPVEGIRQDWRKFLEQCDAALDVADWVGIDLSWGGREELNHPEFGAAHQTYRLWLPEKTLMITRFWTTRQTGSEQAKGEDYLAFYHNLQDLPGYLAAFLFIPAVVNPEQKGIIPTIIGTRLKSSVYGN